MVHEIVDDLTLKTGVASPVWMGINAIGGVPV
jgi:hypothetical protein